MLIRLSEELPDEIGAIGSIYNRIVFDLPHISYNLSVGRLIVALDSIMKQHHFIDPKLINLKSSKREVIKYRQIYHYMCKAHTGASLGAIGNAVGKKDHATVIYSVKQVKGYIETEKEFRDEIEFIEKRLWEKLQLT